MNSDVAAIYLAEKCARVISAISELYNVPLQEATDIFYQSDTSVLIEEKVADLHCRSDKYLATVIWDEHLEPHTV